MRAILTIGCISFCLGLAYYFGTPVRHANHPSPENVPVYLAIGSDPPNLGLLQCELGDYDQTIRNGRGDALIYRTRAYLREELGDHRGAIEDYSEAILLDPKDAGSYICRGRLWSNHQRAIEDYNMAIRINPKSDSAYRCRSFERYWIGDKKGALEDAEVAIRQDPKDATNFEVRGWARYHLGDGNGALDDFSKAIDLEPYIFVEYENRGSIRARLGDLKGAIEDFSYYIRCDPRNSLVYRLRSHARFLQGDRKGALEDAWQATLREPASAPDSIEDSLKFVSADPKSAGYPYPSW